MPKVNSRKASNRSHVSLFDYIIYLQVYDLEVLLLGDRKCRFFQEQDYTVDLQLYVAVGCDGGQPHVFSANHNIVIQSISLDRPALPR
jgi:hypothetical protein